MEHPICGSGDQPDSSPREGDTRRCVLETPTKYQKLGLKIRCCKDNHKQLLATLVGREAGR
jgi:hypothetical protein